MPHSPLQCQDKECPRQAIEPMSLGKEPDRKGFEAVATTATGGHGTHNGITKVCRLM